MAVLLFPCQASWSLGKHEIRVLSEDGYLIAFTSLAIESQCKTLLCFLLKEEVDFSPQIHDCALWIGHHIEQAAYRT